jgi:hypothetical protein
VTVRASAWLRSGAAAFCLVCACKTPLPSRSATPKAVFARNLLPSNLDFVVRIDAERLRTEKIMEQAARDLARERGSDLFRSLLPYLDRSRVFWFGGRFLSDGFHGDGVVVIEGPDADQIAVDPAFVRTASPRPDVQTFERAASPRGEPVLEVRCAEGGVALATPAEADAVLRILQDGPDPGRLEPSARGVVSFVGRARPGFDGATGAASLSLSRFARGLQTYAGSLELVDGIEADVDLSYGSSADASQAFEAARELVARLSEGGGPLKILADSVRLSPRDQTLGLRFKVPLEVLASLGQRRIETREGGPETRPHAGSEPRSGRADDAGTLQ